MSIVQQTDPRLIRVREERIRKLTDASLSLNTRLNYNRDIRRFEAEGYSLPACPLDIIKYLEKWSDKLNPNTLSRHLKALRYVHKINMYVDPTDDPRVKKIMKGIINTYGIPPRRAPPLTIENMRAINTFYVEHAPNMDQLNATRDNALLQIGFFGAFRQSELLKICFEHLTFSEAGVEILLPRSKGDQKGEGQTVAIPYLEGDLCPVTILKTWLDVSKIKTGFLWPALNKFTRVNAPISYHRLYEIIWYAAQNIGIEEWKSYTAHSLRRGFATEAAKNGASLMAIKKQGRWVKMDTLMQYIDEGNKFNQNAASVFAR